MSSALFQGYYLHQGIFCPNYVMERLCSNTLHAFVATKALMDSALFHRSVSGESFVITPTKIEQADWHYSVGITAV